jgi:hypothetical protein
MVTLVISTEAMNVIEIMNMIETDHASMTLGSLHLHPPTRIERKESASKSFYR